MKPKKLSAPDAKALLRAIELGLVPKVKAALAKGPDVNVVVTKKYGIKTTRSSTLPSATTPRSSGC